nr:uncharacterized protein LOC126526076 [Dermacentor andersoni]
MLHLVRTGLLEGCCADTNKERYLDVEKGSGAPPVVPSTQATDPPVAPPTPPPVTIPTTPRPVPPTAPPVAPTTSRPVLPSTPRSTPRAPPRPIPTPPRPIPTPPTPIPTPPTPIPTQPTPRPPTPRPTTPRPTTPRPTTPMPTTPMPTTPRPTTPRPTTPRPTTPRPTTPRPTTPRPTTPRPTTPTPTTPTPTTPTPTTPTLTTPTPTTPTPTTPTPTTPMTPTTTPTTTTPFPGIPSRPGKPPRRFTLICVFEFISIWVWGPVHQCTDYVYIRMFTYTYHRSGDQRIEFSAKKLETATKSRIDWDTSYQYGLYLFKGDAQLRRIWTQFPQGDLYLGMWGMTYMRILNSLWTYAQIHDSIYAFVRSNFSVYFDVARFEGLAIINSVIRTDRGWFQSNETYRFNMFKDPDTGVLPPGWKFIHTCSIWPDEFVSMSKIIHTINFPDIFGISTSNTTEEHNVVWHDASYNNPVNWISPPNPIDRVHAETRSMLDIIADFPMWKKTVNQSKVCFSVTTSINYAHATSISIDFHTEVNTWPFNVVRFRRYNFTGKNDGNKKLNVDDMEMHYRFETRTQTHMWEHTNSAGRFEVFLYDNADTLAPKIERLLDAWPDDKCVVFDDLGEDSMESGFTFDNQTVKFEKFGMFNVVSGAMIKRYGGTAFPESYHQKVPKLTGSG